jgi:ABC-type polar amino acid transport system ATPase subunit
MIDMRNVSKIYQLGSEEVRALDDVTLTIEEHEFTAVIGPSGSGKSTMMNILGCLDTIDAGEYLLDGVNVSDTFRSPEPPPQPAVRRPAAARRHSPRPRHPARADPRRRTDGQPRFPLQSRDQAAKEVRT